MELRPSWRTTYVQRSTKLNDKPAQRNWTQDRIGRFFLVVLAVCAGDAMSIILNSSSARTLWPSRAPRFALARRAEMAVRGQGTEITSFGAMNCPLPDIWNRLEFTAD